MTADAHRTITTVWKIEQAKLIAGLTRVVRDVGLAEELAQDALVAALERWPELGIPANPAAWLMATAKNRALDLFRRRALAERKHAEIGRDMEDAQEEIAATLEARLDDDVGDELLGLMLIACHPKLATEARLALTLRLVGGLTTEEIARAFLASEATIAQRIVRAKRTLAEAGAAFEMPRGAERAARLPSVLEVLYLIFNEGYAATAGDDWMRPQLAEEALRMGRILVGLAPEQAEAHGLVALMEIQQSRVHARVDRGGRPVLLLEQDRGRWDQMLIRRGLAALAKAEALSAGSPGPYTLQAGIAACHGRARTAGETDWRRIVSLYDALFALMPTPVVALNRAVALSMADGPAAGLAAVEALAGEPALAGYHLMPSVRGDLLMKLGRAAEARAEFERAAALTRNERERALLLERAAAAAK
jgi:RNA polymerase sigma factor (sigma-70 family)